MTFLIDSQAIDEREEPGAGFVEMEPSTVRAIRLCFLILVCVLAMTAEPVSGAGDQSPITIAISPPRVELQLDDGPVNEALKVFNLGSRPASIRTSVYSWHLDEDNRVQLEQPTEQSLDQWMIISPLEFTIQPGESQTVRFSVRPRVRPAAGEHRAIVYFDQAPVGQGPVRIVGRMGVAVYAHQGKVERVGELNGIDIDTRRRAPVAYFDISSTGTAHVRLSGSYAVWRADGYPGAEATGVPASEDSVPHDIVASGGLPTLPVLASSRRRIELPLTSQLPPGRYVLDVNGDLGGEPIDLGVPFSVGVSDGTRAAVD